ncbi:MAG: hypothetical protein OXF11_14995 [Deltaproteobacteria bacterium]|nr:hypothetical protein [Deltaproteobacteria bacterium]
MESVFYLGFVAVIVSGVFEVVSTLFMSDILDRAAYAVARDNALRGEPAASAEQLLARAKAAVRAEVGDRLEPDLLRIQVAVYDDPSTMLGDELSGGENAALGGDAGNMVVVRMGYMPSTPLGRIQQALLSDGEGFRVLAVVRNERTVGLTPGL